MKKFLKVIGLIVLLLIAFVLIAGIFAPKDVHLEKSILINAPRDKVWAHVNTLNGMEQWSPWPAKDPNMKKTYEGTPGAIGSVFKWDGNKEVGSGTQTLTKAIQAERVETRLHFLKPFEGNAAAFIILSDSANATKATWGFDSRSPYPMNVMHLFFSMDDMMGKDYKNGLSKLKALSEAP